MPRPKPTPATRANQRSPLLGAENADVIPGATTSGQHEMQEVHGPRQRTDPPHPSRAYIIFVDLINLVMSGAEIALVLYLTVDHFSHSQGVIAVIMLAPILLNFVGVTYFFSDERERKEFEKVGTTRFAKDMFQIPVFGPVFTAFKVLLISSGLSKRHQVEYERFEASAVKMRQAQTFFSAAPEAIVQLSVLLISNEESLQPKHILEIAVVVVSIFTIAEANVYALRSNYFRLFHSYQDGDWEVHESFGRKCILFFHSFCSVASRISAAGCLIAGIQYFTMYLHMQRQRSMMMMAGHNGTSGSTTNAMANTMTLSSPTEQLGFMIGLTFVSLIVYQLIFYYFARTLRYSIMKRVAPGACYESINYAWRSTILHMGFQSNNIATQLWFYLENCIMFALWWVSVEKCAEPRIKRITKLPMTLSFTLFGILSLFFLFAAVGTRMHRLESPFKQEQVDSPPKGAVSK